MTVAPERGGCGGVGSQRTIPLSAQMIVVLQTLAPERKNTHIVSRLHRNEARAFLRNLMWLPLRATAPQHCGTPWDASLTPDLQGIEVSAAHFVSRYFAGWCAKINKGNERMCDNRILTGCTYAFPIVTVVVFWCWNAVRFVRCTRWKSGQEVDKKDDTSNVHGNTALLIYSHSKFWAEALYLHTLRRVGEGWKVMKVGFHVYLMPWFAELHLDVNGNEAWHVENRLCHLSPPQVQQSEREKGAPFLCPLHVSLQADNITSATVSFSKPCVDLRIVCCCSAHGFL